MIDPTNADGVLGVGLGAVGVGAVGVGVGGGAGGEEDSGNDSGEDGGEDAAFGVYGAYMGGTSTPTTSLMDGGGMAGKTMEKMGMGRGGVVGKVWDAILKVIGGPLTCDATLALANEPSSDEWGDAGDRDRKRRANIGVTELSTGTQVVFTLRDVKAGDELLWDYGVDYNRSHYDD